MKLHKRLTEDLGTYLGGIGAERMIAPWDPSDSRTSEQKIKAKEMQDLCAKISKSFHAGTDDAQLLAIGQKIIKAQKRGDAEEVKKLRAERETAYRELRLAALDKLAAAHPEQGELIAACRTAVGEAKLLDFHTKLAEKAMPLLADLPEGKPNIYGARHGYVSDTFGVLRVNANLIDAVDAAPAMVQYLTRQGCRDLHYELRQVYIRGFGGDESDEEP